jgi:multicomponent K+:H+ antiporter subunit F
MNDVLYWSGIFALCCYALALMFTTWRLLTGPTPQDRILALDTMTVNGMLVILVLGVLFGTSLYFDIALLMSMFGFVGSAALAKFLLHGEVIQP